MYTCHLLSRRCSRLENQLTVEFCLTLFRNLEILVDLRYTVWSFAVLATFEEKIFERLRAIDLLSTISWPLPYSRKFLSNPHENWILSVELIEQTIIPWRSERQIETESVKKEPKNVLNETSEKSQTTETHSLLQSFSNGRTFINITNYCRLGFSWWEYFRHIQLSYPFHIVNGNGKNFLRSERIGCADVWTAWNAWLTLTRSLLYVSETFWNDSNIDWTCTLPNFGTRLTTI